MTLPATGNSLSYLQIQQEFGGSATNITLQNYYRVNTAIGFNPTSNIANIANNSNVKQYNAANLTMDMNQWWTAQNGFSYNVAYSSNVSALNLWSAAVTAGWNKTLPLDATVVVRSGYFIYSSSTGTYAFDSGGAGGAAGTYPAGSLLRLHNFGVISGAGGAGGGGTYGTPGTPGSAGGPAMLIGAAARIYVNNTGPIGGGGGGGGGGRGDAGTDGGEGTASYGGGGGGGGAGYVGGSGGGGQGGMNYNGASGSGGSWNAAGGGGGGGSGPAGSAGGGGSGGTSGNAGSSGGNSFASGSGGSGGAAGACISGNTNITWGQLGTRYGTIT